MKQEKIFDILIKGTGILSILYLAAMILFDDQPNSFILIFLTLLAGGFIVLQLKKGEHNERVRIIYDRIIGIILMLLVLYTTATIAATMLPEIIKLI
jgi:hypothetical protein